MYESEVARIRRQIDQEFEALQQLKSGLAFGTARHDFIKRRMHRVDTYSTELADYVGESEAVEMVYTLYNETVK